MQLNSKNVTNIFLDCLFRDSELEGGLPKAGIEMVEVRAVKAHIGFHKERLESHREDVISLLDGLVQKDFKSKIGIHFTQAVMTNENIQWAEHRNLDELICLGLGLNILEFVMAREYWILTNGVPYFRSVQ